MSSTRSTGAGGPAGRDCCATPRHRPSCGACVVGSGAAGAAWPSLRAGRLHACLLCGRSILERGSRRHTIIAATRASMRATDSHPTFPFLLARSREREDIRRAAAGTDSGPGRRRRCAASRPACTACWHRQGAVSAFRAANLWQWHRGAFRVRRSWSCAAGVGCCSSIGCRCCCGGCCCCSGGGGGRLCHDWAEAEAGDFCCCRCSTAGF
jgi:hypothetical protein